MLYVSMLFIFILCMMIAYSILSYSFGERLLIKKRLDAIGELEKLKLEKTADFTFTDRIVKPLYKKLYEMIARVMPKWKKQKLSRKLESAGITGVSAESWSIKKIAITMTITFIIMGLLLLAAIDLTQIFLIAILCMILVHALFNFRLSQRIANRRKQIQKDLPYMIDLITVSVEAGLSFDGAIAKVVNSFDCDLCSEFARCLKEMRMGIQKKIALKSMGDRCGVRELSLLITSIIQADELGVSLGNVLRIEASNQREHRKQVIRERAMKVPIKMLIPLIIFVFPSIFIIILGPAVIQIFDIFLK